MSKQFANCYAVRIGTVSDYMNAVLGAGCSVIEVDEFGDTKADWETAPFDGLPECLLIVSRKSQGHGV